MYSVWAIWPVLRSPQDRLCTRTFQPALLQVLLPRSSTTVCRWTGSPNQFGADTHSPLKYDCVGPNTIVFREWSISPNWFGLPVLLHTVVLAPGHFNRAVIVSYHFPHYFSMVHVTSPSKFSLWVPLQCMWSVILTRFPEEYTQYITVDT